MDKFQKQDRVKEQVSKEYMQFGQNFPNLSG